MFTVIEVYPATQTLPLHTCMHPVQFKSKKHAKLYIEDQVSDELLNEGIEFEWVDHNTVMYSGGTHGNDKGGYKIVKLATKKDPFRIPLPNYILIKTNFLDQRGKQITGWQTIERVVYETSMKRVKRYLKDNAYLAYESGITEVNFLFEDMTSFIESFEVSYIDTQAADMLGDLSKIIGDKGNWTYYRILKALSLA